MEKEKQNEVTGKLFFRNIYWSIFRHYAKKEKHALDYELEYLIGGYESDQKI